MISVLVMTWNEELNLPACLESVAWCDDIVVFDSNSTDRTLQIAKERGARTFARAFDDYAQQRSAALTTVEYRNAWILMLDADERVPPDLATEMMAAVAEIQPAVCMFRMRRKDHMFGRWIRHSSAYPTWFGRLVRGGHVTVTRAINEEFHTDGEVRELYGHLLHFPFNKGIAYWFERHNRYSTMEVEALGSEARKSVEWEKLVSKDPVKRRKAQKSLAYRLPGRPLLVFAYLYLIRGGFLDGMPGFCFCALRSCYELMISLKTLERRIRV